MIRRLLPWLIGGLLVVGVVILATNQQGIPPASPAVAEPVSVIPSPLATFEDFGLRIEKLNISAPIIPDVDGFDEKVYLDALLHGVGQFKGSKTPDKPGNVFIFGHSGYLKRAESDYKEIFKTLDQLKTGDRFTVHFRKKEYTYLVAKSFETHDEDWTLLDPTPENDKDKTITLMTCWPPGTITKRWAVMATQV